MSFGIGAPRYTQRIARVDVVYGWFHIRPMAVHVEDFGVSASLGGTGDACRRGLSELHWTEQRSDRHEVRLPVTGAGDVIGEVILYLLMGLLRLLPVTKRFIHRYTSRTAQAPPGPAETNAEINAVLTPLQTQPMHDLIVRNLSPRTWPNAHRRDALRLEPSGPMGAQPAAGGNGRAQARDR